MQQNFKNNFFRNFISSIKTLNCIFSRFFIKQNIFFRYIWPWGKWNAISHDSYTCQKFPRTQAFPTQRKLENNNFVASVIADNSMLQKTCPIKCRPKDHPDWEYC